MKPGLILIFKALKEKQHYFKKTDFEQMFEAYDFFESKGGNQIPYTYLMQALEKISISYEKEEFLTKYPQFKLDRMVKKIDFINIMEAEYKKKITAWFDYFGYISHFGPTLRLRSSTLIYT